MSRPISTISTIDKNQLLLRRQHPTKFFMSQTYFGDTQSLLTLCFNSPKVNGSCVVLNPRRVNYSIFVSQSKAYGPRLCSLYLSLCFLPYVSSPCSLGPVLAMIHLTRQHLIRAFRVKRGLCHLPLSLSRPLPGSTPLASPIILPSITLPSSW